MPRHQDGITLPGWIKPQLAQLADATPDGDQWLHEIKFDGYRMHARLGESGKVLRREKNYRRVERAGAAGNGAAQGVCYLDQHDSGR